MWALGTNGVHCIHVYMHTLYMYASSSCNILFAYLNPTSPHCLLLSDELTTSGPQLAMTRFQFWICLVLKPFQTSSSQSQLSKKKSQSQQKTVQSHFALDSFVREFLRSVSFSLLRELFSWVSFIRQKSHSFQFNLFSAAPLVCTSSDQFAVSHSPSSEPRLLSGALL